MREAWIEIMIPERRKHHVKSLPLREAWIEMHLGIFLILLLNVASLAGSVD